MAQTTAFKYEALAAVAALTEPSGQDIRRWMEHNQNPTTTAHVNHGRLYPNLDELVDDGLLEKGEQDARTNYYALTDAGRHRLAARGALFSEVA